MQGMIGTESTLGMGTVFWIELDSGVSPHLEIKRAESVSPTAPRSQLLLYVEEP